MLTGASGMATSQMSRVLDHLRRVVGDSDDSDGQLLASFLTNGEQAAFEALVQRHGRMVYGVCQRVLHHSQDAEDAFQATFLVLVRKASSLIHRPNIGDWLYGVAYKTALKARATAMKHRALERKVAEMPHERPLEDIWQDLRPLLDQELHRLPQKYREPVVLCDLEGKTRKEAAQQLGWPEGTVSGRLSRARVMLANRLTRHGLVLSGGSLALVLSQKASASVPAALMVSTANAAALVAAGQAVVTGVISAKVAALTEGVVKAMFMTKLKIATVLVLTVGMAGTGAGVLTWKASAAGEPSGKVVARDSTVSGEDARKNIKEVAAANDLTTGDEFLSDDDRSKDERKDQQRREAEGPTLLPPGILERLDLTAEQKEKIAKLEKEFQEKIAPAKKKFAEAIEQAKQNQDRQKFQEAQEAFHKEIGPIHEALAEKVGQLLTDEQRQRVEQVSRQQRGGPGFDLPRILGQLDLSAEQREKVQKLTKEFGEKHEAAQKKLQEAVEQAKQNQDREKVQELFKGHQQEMGKLHEELMQKLQGVLTDEQRKKFSELQARRGGERGPGPGLGQVLPPPLQERLGLTPEQREKVAKLQRETEAKLKEILNEEQNRTLDEIKKGGPPERRKPRE